MKSQDHEVLLAVMENKTEATILLKSIYWGYIGIIESKWKPRSNVESEPKVGRPVMVIHQAP